MILYFLVQYQACWKHDQFVDVQVRKVNSYTKADWGIIDKVVKDRMTSK